MGKKRFSEGLNDLFSESNAAQQGSLFGEDRPVPAAAERKVVHKNFLQDIDSLLQEALEESMERYASNQPDTTTPSSKTKTTAAAFPSRGTFSGLDTLIRQTIDVQEIQVDESTGKKRLTVAVDRSKLDKLKTIARLENAYLKDLLIQVIDGYIDEYTKHKGVNF